MYVERALATASPASQRTASQLPVVRDREAQRLNSYLMLAFADSAVIVASFMVAALIHLGAPLADHALILIAAAVPIYFGCAALNQAYSGAALHRPERSFSRSMQAMALAGGAIALMLFLLKAGDTISRAVFAIGWVIALFGVPLVRLLLGAPLLRHMGGTPFTTVVIVDRVAFRPERHDVVISAQDLGFDPATGDPLMFNRLARAVAHADRVLVAAPMDRFGHWSTVLKSMGTEGALISDGDDPLGITGIGRYGSQTTLVVANGPLHMRDRVFKRSFDVAVAALAIVLLSPVLLATAIAIKLESRGPVLFRQRRIGKDNKLFPMLKFRSMYHDSCDPNAATLTRRDDERVTRVGRFIRRTSIDELPQLFNVLRGNMSIVGPRPHALSAKAADQLYWDVDTRYRHRHSIKPGLTGLAQVRGFRGPTDHADDLKNRLASDLEYLANWSLRLDLVLVIRTALSLFHRNAF